MRVVLNMAQSYTFTETNKFGKSIEDRVSSCFLRMYPGASIVDVSGDKKYQQKGIDLIVKRTLPYYDLSVEVKGDEKIGDSSNFFFETKSNEELGKPGWFLYSEALLLSYVSVTEKAMYLMFLETLKERVMANEKKFKTARTSTKSKNGKILYHTSGLLVPKDEVYRWKDIYIAETLSILLP